MANNNNQTNKPAKQNDIINPVAERVRLLLDAGELHLPDTYSPQNALKSAYLILLETKDRNKKPVLQVCSRASIQNALMNMIIMGLSPSKHQCAFIARGEKLICQPQYQGNVIRAKRQARLVDFNANAIHEGDEFDFEIEPVTGRKYVTHHKQTLESLDNEVIGAYATLMFGDGKRNYTDIMTIKQIRKSWEQGDTNGNSPAHKKFPYSMAEKTVLNRALKPYIEGSDDADLFGDNQHDEEYHVTEGAQPVTEEDELIDIPDEVDNNDEQQQEPEYEPDGQPANQNQKKTQPAQLKEKQLAYEPEPQQQDVPDIFGNVGDPPPPPPEKAKAKSKKPPF